MPIVRNILVPVDFSQNSRHVLDFGRLLADASGASLHLLHVVSPALTPATDLDEQRRDACRRLTALLDEIDGRPPRATTYCEVGTPAHEIVRYATDHGIDVIVMGTHWHGPSFQMATGSIAESVVGSAPCAVLAVKGVGPEGRAPARDSDPLATTMT
jgi:nucleotide-binding universal stress UspA family protein